MNRLSYIFGIALTVLTLSACATAPLSQIQDPISHFDQATHTAANSESAFLNAVQTVDCEAQFYKTAYEYSLQKKKSNFDLTGYCKPEVITSEQIDTRNKLMSAIVLYADKMQALATSDDNKQLDANSQTLAENLNKLASSGGIKLKDPAIVQGVETAVIAIADMALDRVKYSTIRSAAQSMQPHLNTVVTALKSENIGFGMAMNDSLGQIEITMRTLIADLQKKDQEPIETFFDIINSRNLIISADPLTKRSLALPANTPIANPLDIAKPINDALDAVVSCNQAIANPKTGSGGIYAAAEDLFKRAIVAKDIYNSIASAK